MRRLLLTLAVLACAHAPEAPTPAPQPAAPVPVEIPAAERYRQARDSMQQGQWDVAQQKLDVYLAKKPKSAAGWFDAGWVSERRGDAKSAQADYRKVLELEPAHLGAALNLARLQEEPESA